MKFSRRGFLNTAGAGLLGLAASHLARGAPETPMLEAPALGRVTVPALTVRGGPGTEYPVWGALHMDEVVLIYGQAVGEPLQRFNDVWYNVGSGYVFSSFVQPVEDVRNPIMPVDAGFWGEITVPYADSREAPDPGAPALHRFYCHSVYWVREVVDSWYRLDTRRDRRAYWVPAEAVRRIPPGELTPLGRGAEEKRIVIDLALQQLTAFEDGEPVLVQRISSGMRLLSRGMSFDYRTRPGSFDVTSKRPTTHMIGGTQGIDAYDLPGVPWSVFFHYTGLAIHGAYWHNDFGRPRSHGCIHVPPRVAQWIYRWTAPHADYDEDRLVAVFGGTRIKVG